VLSQNPKDDSQWIKDFADPVLRAKLTHSPGNLVLTMDNSSYGRKDFADKRGTPAQVTPAC
jgi:hypothetical protein